MTHQDVPPEDGRLPPPARQVGYGIAIVINVILIWVVTNLLEWDLLPFLTEDFSEVVPFMVTSLLIGAFVNAMYVAYDSRLVRRLGDVVTSTASLIVIVKLFGVFPFEFDSGPWAGVTRAVLVFVGLALAVATVANLAKVVVSVSKGKAVLDG